MAKITTPKEAYEYLFDENASLIVEVGIGELDGRHKEREEMEDLFMKLPNIEELSIAFVTINNHTEHPNGTYVADFNLESKLIDATLTMNAEGDLIVRGVAVLGNIMCKIILINLFNFNANVMYFLDDYFNLLIKFHSWK